MGEFLIRGGNRLEGNIKINGAKNAVLPILAAAILNSGECIIHNCPRISDTFIAVDILKALGCKVNVEGNTVIIDSSPMNNTEVPEALVRKMRSSIIFLSGILSRLKKVKISFPGGCELGARPIDLHLKGFREMGAHITEDKGCIICESTELKGKRIELDYPSVGATENIMIAAVLAKGRTVIGNAAREPEINDLQNFLNSMGAKIVGAGTSTITIDGVKELKDTEYSVMPDRIEAGTYLAAAAMTRGNIVLDSIIPAHLYPITSKLEETGCSFKVSHNSLNIRAPKILKGVDILRTLPHPGFPTDMQPQMMSLLTVSRGTSIIIETVFESRNKHIGELVRMGADVISEDGRVSIIKGVKRLSSATVEAKDLRGGAALIIAALAAEGKTTVTNSKHVERGYESIHKTLASVGADIEFIGIGE